MQNRKIRSQLLLLSSYGMMHERRRCIIEFAKFKHDIIDQLLSEEELSKKLDLLAGDGFCSSAEKGNYWLLKFWPDDRILRLSCCWETTKTSQTFVAAAAAGCIYSVAQQIEWKNANNFTIVNGDFASWNPLKFTSTLTPLALLVQQLMDNPL